MQQHETRLGIRLLLYVLFRMEPPFALLFLKTCIHVLLFLHESLYITLNHFLPKALLVCNHFFFSRPLRDIGSLNLWIMLPPTEGLDTDKQKKCSLSQSITRSITSSPQFFASVLGGSASFHTLCCIKYFFISSLHCCWRFYLQISAIQHGCPQPGFWTILYTEHIGLDVVGLA